MKMMREAAFLVRGLGGASRIISNAPQDCMVMSL